MNYDKSQYLVSLYWNTVRYKVTVYSAHKWFRIIEVFITNLFISKFIIYLALNSIDFYLFNCT